MYNALMQNNKLFGFFLITLLVIGSFGIGLKAGRTVPEGASLQAGVLSFFTATSAKPADEADLSEFWRVWNLLDNKYVTGSASGTPEQIEKLQGAISGMVESFGDPYTVYMPPADAAAFSEDISGNFSGVGMEVGLRNRMITVIAPLPDTPAERAGIQTGDVVTKIDGVNTDGMGIDEAVRLIRGEKGTEVVLTIYRQGESDFLEIKIIRDTIAIPTIATETKDDTFIIKLYSFNALSESKTKEALNEYKQSGHKKLVLDLRGNPGGFLESAVNIASYFLPSGKVVVRESFGGEQEEQVYRTNGQQIVEVNPDNFVVLIDGGSASASEILAGALSEHEVATTIGVTTFGKGSVQELIQLPAGSALKVTIARWLTPEGISFSEGGLKPDVEIPRTPQQVTEGEDTQTEAAMQWLDGKRDLGEKVSFEF